jgi:cytochrome c553
MRYAPFLLIILLVLGVYVLPTAFARFAGTHTMEVNKSAGISGLDCIACHQIIFDELNATAASRATTQAHRNAAGNTSYTRNWLNMTIDNTSEVGVCYLCHRPQTDVINSHTMGVVRACTDLDCHGNNGTVWNNTAYPSAGQVGRVLGGHNVHEPFFDGMSAYDSRYINETGSNYTLGFWACLGCHTEVTVTRNLTKTPFQHNDPNQGRKRYI